jgi:pectate lyase
MKRVYLLIGVVCSCFWFATGAVYADGFAGAVTGGAGGNVVTVSTASSLKSYAESSSTYVVQVSGTIDLGSIGGAVYIRSNKTIKGITANAKIIGNLQFSYAATNVIIENLLITDPYAGDTYDGISVSPFVTNVLITKCTVYDCGDGCIDITDGSDYITVSWCKFYYSDPAPAENHRFVCLVGNSYPSTIDPGKLHVTFHHNWWADRCVERMPSVRYGRAHIYNNYYTCSENNYCIRTRVDAQCLLEHNYFYYVHDPFRVYLNEMPLGLIDSRDDILIGCSGSWDDWDEDVFTPPYFYVIDDANYVPSIVQAYAGAQTPNPPHWYSRPYGDFNGDGTVDQYDLEQFMSYWLQTSGIEEADIDYDGNVNLYEFSLLAQDWLEP